MGDLAGRLKDKGRLGLCAAVNKDKAGKKKKGTLCFERSLILLLTVTAIERRLFTVSSIILYINRLPEYTLSIHKWHALSTWKNSTSRMYQVKQTRIHGAEAQVLHLDRPCR